MAEHDTTITIRLPRDVVESLDRLAEEDGVARSTVVRRMLLSEIGRRA